jgi:hypothetical protein
LLEAIRHAGTSPARRALLQQVEKLGLSALPAVRQFLTKMKADEVGRSDLEDLARRLALTVAVVNFTQDSVKPGSEFLGRLEACRGKPIHSQVLGDLVFSTIRELPPDCRGIRVTADRPGDYLGVRLIVTLIADKPRAELGLWEARVWESLLLDGRSVVVEVGNPGAQASVAAINWKGFPSRLQALLLRAKPNQSVLFATSAEKL